MSNFVLYTGTMISPGFHTLLPAEAGRTPRPAWEEALPPATPPPAPSSSALATSSENSRSKSASKFRYLRQSRLGQAQIVRPRCRERLQGPPAFEVLPAVSRCGSANALGRKLEVLQLRLARSEEFSSRGRWLLVRPSPRRERGSTQYNSSPTFTASARNRSGQYCTTL